MELENDIRRSQLELQSLKVQSVGALNGSPSFIACELSLWFDEKEEYGACQHMTKSSRERSSRLPNRTERQSFERLLPACLPGISPRGQHLEAMRCSGNS